MSKAPLTLWRSPLAVAVLLAAAICAARTSNYSAPPIVLASGPTGLELRLTKGSRGVEPFTFESASAAAYTRYMQPELTFATDSVALLSDGTPEVAIPIGSGSSGLGSVLSVAEAELCVAGSFLPRTVSANQTIRTQLRTPSEERSVQWTGSLREVQVAGIVAAALDGIRPGSGTVFALAPSDIPLAREVRSAIDALLGSLDPHSVHAPFPNHIIVGNEVAQPELSKFSPSHDPLSNLIIGPYARESAALRWRVATLVAAHFMKLPEDPTHQVQALGLAAAVGDIWATTRLNGRSCTTGERAVDSALYMLPRVGAPRESINDRFLFQKALRLDAPLQRAAIQREYPGIAQRSVPLQDLERLAASAISYSDQDALGLVEQRLAASSHVRASEHTSISTVGLEFDIYGEMRGYLEECGCKGIIAGGLKRVMWLDSLGTFPNGLILNGNMLAAPGRDDFSPESGRFILDSFRRLHVTAYVPAMEELLLIASDALSIEDFSGLPMTAANIRSRDSQAQVWSAFRDIEVNGTPIRVIGVADASSRLLSSRTHELIHRQFSFEDIGQSISTVLESTPTDMPVLITGCFHPAALAHLPATEHAMVIVNGDPRFPRNLDGNRARSQVDGYIDKVPVVFDPFHGYGSLRLLWDPTLAAVEPSEMRLDQAVPPQDPAAQSVQRFLESLDDDEEVELDYRDPRLARGSEYVGSSRCGTCHQAEADHWLSTPHAKAIKTLQKVQRHRVRNCVACHVVGFEQPTGFSPTNPNPDLTGVGCETCHGPGSDHLASPSNENIRRTPSEELCATCHTLDHSPYLLGAQAQYFARVAHPQ